MSSKTTLIMRYASISVFLPVVERSLSDLDGAQLLDAAMQTHRHVGVWDVKGLPLPAGAAGEAMRRGRDGGRSRHLLHQS